VSGTAPRTAGNGPGADDSVGCLIRTAGSAKVGLMATTVSVRRPE
jgi:hypothetical protein